MLPVMQSRTPPTDEVSERKQMRIVIRCSQRVWGVYKERRRGCGWPVKEQREVGRRDCPRQEWRRMEGRAVSDGRGELWSCIA